MEDRIWINRYSQNDQKFISFVMDFETLNRTSKVLVYGESKYGYQRKPDKKHYVKVKRYLVEDDQAMLPSSIILGADSAVLSRYIKTEKGHSYLDLKGVKDKIFRIVDGQHRLKGLEEAVKSKPELAHFMFNVVVVETDVSERYKELSLFTDINSKGKRIRVDLALLAKYNYEVYGGSVDSLGIHIAVKTAYKLKENRDPKNIWRNGINFDIHEEKALGIVSVNAFVKSIKPMCDRYLRDSELDIKSMSDQAIYEVTEKASDFIMGLLLEAWTIIGEKWGGCFSPTVENDYFYDIKEFYYNRKYYIQKTLGVRVLNTILYESVRQGKITEYNLGHFYRTIIASNVNISNWSTGDIFAGLSSQSGFRIAKNYILNK